MKIYASEPPIKKKPRRNNKQLKKALQKIRKKTTTHLLPSFQTPFWPYLLFLCSAYTHPDGSSPFLQCFREHSNCFSYFPLHFLAAGIFLFLFPFLVRYRWFSKLTKFYYTQNFQLTIPCCYPEGRLYQYFIHKNQLTVTNWVYKEPPYPFKISPFLRKSEIK